MNQTQMNSQDFYKVSNQINLKRVEQGDTQKKIIN
jgi:hypothetical protein